MATKQPGRPASAAKRDSGGPPQTGGSVHVRSVGHTKTGAIRYEADLVAPDGKSHTLTIATTPEGYRLLLEDLAKWAKWEPYDLCKEFLAEPADGPVNPALLQAPWESPLLHLLTRPWFRSRKQADPSGLRKTKASINKRRRMTEEMVREVGPFWVVWAERCRPKAVQEDRESGALLERVLRLAETKGYKREEFQSGDRLLPRVLAAFLFQENVSRLDPNRWFANAGLELPMRWQQNAQTRREQRRKTHQEYTVAGVHDYFNYWWRSDRKNVKRWIRAYQRQPLASLHKRVHAFLEDRRA